MPQPAGQCFLKPNTAGRTPHAGLTSGTCAPLPPGTVPITYNHGDDATAVAALAVAADVVIAVVTPGQGCEGADRTNLSLPDWQNAMVLAAVKANARTVVVTRCAGACLMPWLDAVPAVVQHAFAGQEAGSALANILFGVVNPSGKLPLSFPSSETDTWIQTPSQYPGVLQDGFYQVDYSEDLLVGYRWYDTHSVAPLFPFGHGLSYSVFTLDFLSVSGAFSASTSLGSVSVSASICNVAGPFGAEVVQLYITFPSSANQPPLSLRHFSKVPLAPDECRAVEFVLTPHDVRTWSTVKSDWSMEPGAYGVFVGTSSRNLPLNGSFSVSQ